MMRQVMTDQEAKSRSRELSECGYDSWLENRIRSQAVDMFASATSEDDLPKARLLYDMASIVRDIIRDNAR